MMGWLIALVKSEPLAAQWLLQCALNLAADFGLHLTPAQHFGMITFSAAVLALLARQSVTPLSKAPTLP